MRRLFVFAALTAILVSCAKESGETTEVNSSQRKTLTVSMPEISRVSLGTEADGKIPLLWSAGDRIALIQDKGPSQKVSVYQLVGDGGEASGTFEYVSGDASSNDGDIKDIIYPASRASDFAIPTSQTYREGQVDPDANLMTWHSDSGIGPEGVTLSPAGAIICVQMTGASFWSIASVAAKVNGTDYAVACTPAVSFTDTTTVKPFYITVPATASSQDVEVKVTLGEGGYTHKLAVDQSYVAGNIYRYPECKVIDKGDFYNGEGIVFTSICQSSDGRGLAKIVSPDQTTCAFSTETVDISTTVKHKLDEGINNTALITALDSYKADPDKYPGVKWATGHGDGWYLNCSIEVSHWYNAFIQNWPKTGHSAANAKDVFSHFGATWFTTGTAAYYQTSCEMASDRANKSTTRRMHSDKGVSNKTKDTETLVRACKMIVFYKPE